MNRDVFTIHTDELNLLKFLTMANLLSPVKKFVRMNREEKAATLLCIGFAGILVALILDAFKLLPQATAAELTIGIFVVSFGAGCLLMVTCFIGHEEKAARFAGCGAFGYFGLLCVECIVSYLVEHLTSATLPQITAWYGYPCLILFFIGILMLVWQVVRDTWKRA